MSEVTETHSFTPLKDCEIRNVWTINNYSLCLENKLNVLISPIFPNTHPIRTVWRLRLHPNLKDNNESVHVELDLVRNAKTSGRIIVKFRLGILNDNQEEICTTEVFEKMFNHNYSYTAAIPYRQKLKKGKRKSKNSKPYEGDKLIVFCEISTRDPEDDLGNFSIPECNFLNHLENIFGNPQFSDITLSAGGMDFQAHKVILAARSPVFKAMLTHNMQEKLNSLIKITDMEPEVLREMLYYMYTGKTFDLFHTATDLLNAANKYGLDALKAICGKTIYAGISSENAAEVFQVAQFYSVGELMMQTQTYIRANFDQISESESWILMKNTNPSIVHTILFELKSQQNGNTRTGESSILNESNVELLYEPESSESD